MPWYPEAIRREIPRFRTRMTPVRVNLHTAVSSTTSLYSYFAVPGRVCSHFYVRQDGTVEQYVDTAYRAAADLEGNADTISVESWDGYLRTWRDGDPVPPWTPAQVDSLARLTRWVLDAHPSIPARLAVDSLPGPTSRGVSWHRLGVNPWRKPGGLLYSNAVGKVCPGDARIAQIPTILARATADATPEGDEMTPEQARQLKAVYDAIFNGGTSMPEGKPLKDLIADGGTATRADLARVEAKVDAIGAAAGVNVDALTAEVASRLTIATKEA